MNDRHQGWRSILQENGETFRKRRHGTPKCEMNSVYADPCRDESLWFALPQAAKLHPFPVCDKEKETDAPTPDSDGYKCSVMP